ncbi:hypothetical protein WIS52_19065 [Pseudonocardia nematodicida]|uniref:Methyltransferase family protein n=1 Tax=Pseudonocardia nematodicida TaxID=1206997 RepID=A0ABV1KE30_9PSEU
MNATDPEDFMSTKLDFSNVYSSSSPVPLIELYRNLDYVVPYHVEHFVARLIDRLALRHALATPRVVDIGCSYGLSALMLQQGRQYDDISTVDLELWHHRPETAPKSPTGKTGIEVFGVDPSAAAIDFCQRTSVQRWSWAGDLERDDLPAEYCQVAKQANFILSSGAYGYITERSVCRILDQIEDPGRCWIGNFALTPLDYRSSAMAFADYGYKTEASPFLFPHRRFSSKQERDGTVATLREAGLDASVEERTGYLHTRFYLSRPVEDAVEDLGGFWALELSRHQASQIVSDNRRPLFGEVKLSKEGN